MLKLTDQQGNASILSVFAVAAVLGLYVLHDQRKTQNLRAEVLGSSLSTMASQANVAALARTKSLLTQNAGGTAAVTVQNNAFQLGSGSGFQIKQGALMLNAPDPRGSAWINPGTGSTTASRVSVEKVELDASGKPKAVIAIAETTLASGNASKSVKTRARFDLLAMNPPPAPPTPGSGGNGGSGTGSSVAANPGSGGTGTSGGSTTLASNGSNPCSPNPGVGNSTASSQTGNNTSNSTAQGANTGTSATTTQNSAAGCSTSQTGGSSATAMSSGTGSQVTAQNSTTTTGNSSNANSSVSASGSGSVSASSSASASVGTGKK